MELIIVIGVLLSGFISFLCIELLQVRRIRGQIPNRICVTGSRGKSSVVRLLAAIVRADGRRVVAKTTGSKASLIKPSGEERVIERRGRPSFLEQKRILREGAKRDADTLIIESMSIRPENRFAETVQILDPHILAVCNLRKDHMDELGETKEEIMESFSVNLPKDGTVFSLDEDFGKKYKGKIQELGSKLISVEGISGEWVDDLLQRFSYEEFEKNLSLAIAVSRYLGIDVSVIEEGLKEVKPDYGSLRMWHLRPEESTEYLFVNAFGANDPLSTMEILSKIEAKFDLTDREVIGLFNIRRDRGRRTIQWVDELNGGKLSRLDKLYLTGDYSHSLAVQRRLKLSGETTVSVIKPRKPEEMFEIMTDGVEGSSLLFGFGNIAGLGSKLVDYCEGKAERIDTSVR